MPRGVAREQGRQSIKSKYALLKSRSVIQQLIARIAERQAEQLRERTRRERGLRFAKNNRVKVNLENLADDGQVPINLANKIKRDNIVSAAVLTKSSNAASSSSQTVAELQFAVKLMY